MPRSVENPVPTRIGGRIKKAKVVFDPSDLSFPKKRTLNPTTAAAKTSPSLNSDSANSSKQKKSKKESRPAVNNPNNKRQKQKKQQQQQEYQEEKKIKIGNDEIPMNPQSVLKPRVITTKTKNSSSSNSNNMNENCVVCEKPETIKSTKLISCKECNTKVHSGCFKINFQNPYLVEERWRCKNCKTCVVCDETKEGGYLLTCCICVDSYHYNCHTPKLQISELENSKFNWECYKCLSIMETTISHKSSIIDDEIMNSDYENKDENTFLSDDLNTSSQTLDQENEDEHRNDIRLLFNQRKLTKEEEDEMERRIANEKPLFDDISDVYSDDDDGLESDRSSLVSSSSSSILSLPSTSSCTNLTSSSISSIAQDKNEDDNDDDYDDEKTTTELFKFFQSNDDVPDISPWTCEELSNYIQIYLPNEAKIFMEQEIDGASCLLLKRSDVVNGLSLKLGPALRLHCLVAALQTRTRDAIISWM